MIDHEGWALPGAPQRPVVVAPGRCARRTAEAGSRRRRHRARSVPVKAYVAATGWPQESSPFTSTAQRVAADPAWTYHEWDTRHNVMHDGPQRVLELLLMI